jgi:hypothetical protein
MHHTPCCPASALPWPMNGLAICPLSPGGFHLENALDGLRRCHFRATPPTSPILGRSSCKFAFGIVVNESDAGLMGAAPGDSNDGGSNGFFAPGVQRTTNPNHGCTGR